jgi:hypothetical protein
MPINKVQHQKGYSMFDLMENYGTEEQCESALFKWRWPQGFVCIECQHKGYCYLINRKLFQCNKCHHQTSLMSNTLFSCTKLPLTVWFMAMHLVTQSKTSISALELKRQLGVNYKTAWSIKHKLLQGMKEYNDQIPISGTIQLDDVYWGGEHRGGKRGRGSENKTPFVAAVSLDEESHPIAMKMTVVDAFRKNTISDWAQKHLVAGSEVTSDKLACFTAVTAADCGHIRIKCGGNLELLDSEYFKWVNTMIGNVKTALTGTCHAIDPKHLPRYLAEFCFRFNHRFNLRKLLPLLGQIMVKTPPMPKKYLKLAESCG